MATSEPRILVMFDDGWCDEAQEQGHELAALGEALPGLLLLLGEKLREEFLSRVSVGGSRTYVSTALRGSDELAAAQGADEVRLARLKVREDLLGTLEAMRALDRDLRDLMVRHSGLLGDPEPSASAEGAASCAEEQVL